MRQYRQKENTNKNDVKIHLYFMLEFSCLLKNHTDYLTTKCLRIIIIKKYIYVGIYTKMKFFFS